MTKFNFRFFHSLSSKILLINTKTNSITLSLHDRVTRLVFYFVTKLISIPFLQKKGLKSCCGCPLAGCAGCEGHAEVEVEDVPLSSWFIAGLGDLAAWKGLACCCSKGFRTAKTKIVYLILWTPKKAILFRIILWNVMNSKCSRLDLWTKDMPYTVTIWIPN